MRLFGRLPAITQAAATLGASGAGELDRLGGLVTIDGSAVVFAHPLIRSAVYYAASPAQRRAAHAALAQAEDGDRRAWHLARAASGPDELAAEELERSAERTLRRSGYGAAAAAFERAAELSPDEAGRSRRLAAAADAAWHGADTARVRALLEAAERLPPPEPAVRLRLRYIRGLIELRCGVPADGLAILLPGAAEAVKVAPHLAVAMLTAAGECAFQAGDEHGARDIAALLAALPDSGDPRDAVLAGLYQSVSSVPRGEAPGPVDPDLDALEELDDMSWAQAAGSAEAGALAARARALLADPDEADALFEQSLRLHTATDRPMEQARTALLYGEHLRRHRRRVDARDRRDPPRS